MVIREHRSVPLAILTTSLLTPPIHRIVSADHGVYQVPANPIPAASTDPSAKQTYVVSKFYQKSSVAEMAAAGAVRADDTVLIDSGVIYFSHDATMVLIALARTYPLDCCTYLGLDMHRRPLRIELYSDIMMAMGGGMGLTKADYHAVATSDTQLDRIASAREIMWNKLLDMPFYAAVVEGGHFSHVGTTTEYLQLLTRPTEVQMRYGLRTTAAWYEDGRRITDTGGCAPEQTAAAASSSGGTFTVQNSLFHSAGHKGRGSVVEHSELSGDWHVGDGALVSSLRSVPHAIVRDGIAVQELRVQGHKGRVISVLGVVDPIKDAYTKSSARICGAKWADVFSTAGVNAGDIWPGVAEPSAMTIWTAKLFPVFPASPSSASSSSADSLSSVDPVTADRASMWLQWLAVDESSSSGSCGAVYSAQRKAHLTPKVLSAWRSATRLSLKDILGDADASIEFAWRRALRGKIDVSLLVGAVAQGGNSVPVSELVNRLGRGAIPVSSLSEGVGTAVSDVAASRLQFGGSVDPAAFALQALRGLDRIAATLSADIAGRALAVQSALLWAMAGWGSHGHMSGPAHNAAWLPAFALLDGGYDGGNASDGTSSASSSSSAAASAGKANASRATAIKKMAELRDSWIHRAHLIGRAARHYERAAQLLTAQCIYTAPVTQPQLITRPATGKWCVATCPVRVDLAGGWSDTPPITYEAPPSADGAAAGVSGTSTESNASTASASSVSSLAASAMLGGGMVVNVAVKVDGAQPLGCRTRRTAATSLDASAATITIRTRASADVEERRQTAAEAIRNGEGGAPGRVVGSVVLRSLADLQDFNQPHAEGALVKCALLCLGLVKLPRYDPDGQLVEAAPDLQSQLSTALGPGCSLEVETWSLVPHGSGLGSSSILAGTVFAAVAGCLGRRYDRHSINHMVLKLEQMLSTGGGWQDQVGGMWPGVKASFCPASLPVRVSVVALTSAGTSADGDGSAAGSSGAGAHASSDAATAGASVLDSHMFLIYTGKTRLAKNLLQRVLRQWALRENEVTQTVADLRSNAVTMATALHVGDPAAVGASLDAYWSQKKRMAPMAEPEEVTEMLSVLRPHIYGASLCGAGGGGFMVGVSKEPRAHASINKLLREHPATGGLQWSLHACSVDNEGLMIAESD